MEGFVKFCLLVSLLLVASDSTEAQKIASYFKLGSPLTLRPPFSGKISSIVWKFNGNLAAEWATEGVPLTYYASFDGRTTLNTETGELVINNAKKDDIGEFVVEINNMVQPQRFEPVEIKDVPEPKVHLRPLSCGPASPSCNLLCDGDIKESGPVTYSWRKGDGEWTESQQVMDITNDEETKKIQTFSCKMKNPVSEKESEAVKNPFLDKGSTDGDENGGGGGGVAGAVIGSLVGVGAVVLAVLGYLKRDKLKEVLPCFEGSQSGTAKAETPAVSATLLDEVRTGSPPEGKASDATDK